MRPPAHFARQVEEHPVLPRGEGERVSGYGVMGLPFTSGHVLGLRRWTASSVGDGFTSIWHRDPGGRWTFYESVDRAVGCTRYFGAGVGRVEVASIELDWETSNRLHVRTTDATVDWTIETGSTPLTRIMSAMGVATPMAAWRSRAVLTAMGVLVGPALGVGKVRLTGETSNGQHFEANPRRIWYVTESHAVVGGVQLGRPGPLIDQARIADFYIPQRGILAAGRVFITNPTEQAERPTSDSPNESVGTRSGPR
jgi:hypothetical protein